MSRYWSSIVKNIEPYVPGEQPKDRKYIKLNTNENPYPPSPRVLEAIRRAAGEDLRLYPDPDCSELRETAAEYYGLNKNQIFVGNGSDEVLAFSFMAFFDPERPILFPDITYSFYPVYAKLFNIGYEIVPLDDQLNIPEEKLYKSRGGVIISNPKAPTGQLLPISSISKIVENNMDSVVIIDEAYIDFGGESAAGLIDSYPNLLVVQTLSKSRSLAGMRIGFALGDSSLIEALGRIKNSFNSYTIDRIALAAANESFRDEEYFRSVSAKIICTRERTASELKDMGFTVLDSKANFLFISHPDVAARDLFELLRDKGILVRYFNKPRIDSFLRITIGNDSDMDYVLETIKNLLQSCRI
ncbi:histidinol-phosphate aminotransferase [Anaerobacterium chartisolvens]|uniref:Histidinol-phosphate aminotransferase n=1 Tax=Anaerobacterium chartisolvens TaxID=1297424 RepID=A0A369AL69_9FIRM|nr:histidinol-phosphate transaminase [Anaerobacterium chartisolvens]RCX08917.1 histidinol-phosphate aminotransferase [Anaerobacterium chartisolvens]